MSQSVRAIYHDGQLRLLDPVDLAEGQEIRLAILPSGNEADLLTQQLRAAGLLAENWGEIDQEIAELEARGVIAATEPVALPAGSRPSEELIDEDRGDY